MRETPPRCWLVVLAESCSKPDRTLATVRRGWQSPGPRLPEAASRGSDGVPDTGATGDPQDTVAAGPMRWFDEGTRRADCHHSMGRQRGDLGAGPRHRDLQRAASAFVQHCSDHVPGVVHHRGIRPPVVGQRDQRLREHLPTTADPDRLVHVQRLPEDFPRLGRRQIRHREQIADGSPTLAPPKSITGASSCGISRSSLIVA
jgi:hypothetical protein